MNCPTTCLLALLTTGLVSVNSSADPANHFKVGLGTDAGLGLALGAEYQMDVSFGSKELRVGPAFYYTAYSEDSSNGFNDYTETFSALIFGVTANFYTPVNDPNLNLVYGGGVAFTLSDWQETSPTDSSIGPFDGSVYVDEASGGGAAFLLNFGLNKIISDALAIELNVPIFIVPTEIGTIYAPAITISVAFGLGS